jgi:hypothetical protein
MSILVLLSPYPSIAAAAAVVYQRRRTVWLVFASFLLV